RTVSGFRRLVSGALRQRLRVRRVQSGRRARPRGPRTASPRQRATAFNIVDTVLDFCVGDTNLLSTATSHRVEPRMRARIPVVEIMTQTPVTIHGDATAKTAAGLMREKDIGSLVVVDTGKPMGIVTERDLVTKVAAEDKQPSRVLVRDIMTSPVVAVHPHEEVAEAAK